MLSDQSPFDAYKHTNVNARAAAANQHELVRMLLEGLLDELARAEGHLAARRVSEKGASIGKCLDIIHGLDSALDMEQGGEIAQNLHRLYDYCSQQLFQASLKNDATLFAPVVKVISDVRDGWQNLN
ncbi:flagellar export chaperone FliS [Ferrimonas balearica]|uniref:flagellar export chaperone FliS n=1 Tax=Ferrimonas balearica TaxID=44012 RepID=UPI001C9A0B4B|nr:flagellar export chaperone FliS [Ferrimonas balearica]MBY5920031.1 flagellar export chaperone FliS [Ferrimonas balearica]MBY5997284.1 flagellar export chaperone FliS [Ferrimonas balearica]